MGTVVLVLICLVVAVFVIASVSRSVNKARGRHRCEECRSRLKKAGPAYAPVCSRCSHRQSWAPARTGG